MSAIPSSPAEPGASPDPNLSPETLTMGGSPGAKLQRETRGTVPQPETALSRRAGYRWVGRLGACLIRLWGATLRVERQAPESLRELERLGRPVIFTFWHSHILPLTYTHRGRGVVVLVSQHKDGEYIAQVIHRLGYGTVRGSSSRGGLRSLLEMVRAGRLGHSLSVTPDGPRGPRRELQAGVLLIASRSGLPIVPMGFGARRCRFLRSWDRFEIPHPFSRVLVIEGEPIHVPGDLPQEILLGEWKGKVERAMAEAEERAERWVGRTERAQR